MLKPGYYRRQAITCLNLARSTRDSELSSRLVDMAMRFLGKARLGATDQDQYAAALRTVAAARRPHSSHG
jgi:hypothetical protein